MDRDISLRSAIVVFLYKNDGDAIDTKGRLKETFEMARKTEELDPFLNFCLNIFMVLQESCRTVEFQAD